MSRSLLFLADAQLKPHDITAHCRFIQFLRNLKNVERIYLLGDIFHYWFGPRQLVSGEYCTVLKGLRDLTKAGLSISFLGGNHDYLIDKSFEVQTGVEVLRDEVEVELGRRRVYLTHGDLLLSNNSKFLAFRRMMRIGWVREIFIVLPDSLKTVLLFSLRQISQYTGAKAKCKTTRSDRDLLERANQLFQRGIDVIICGHRHRPRHLIDGRRELFVVGQWKKHGHYLEFDGSAFKRRSMMERQLTETQSITLVEPYSWRVRITSHHQFHLPDKQRNPFEKAEERTRLQRT